MSNNDISKKSGDQAGRKPITRRDLLRRTAVSMPAILTLQSGAALARSSNLISTSTTDYTDRAGRTLCLDTESVLPADKVGEVYDLGAVPYARVNAIVDRDYREEPSLSARSVSEAELCRTGRTAYVRVDGYSADDMNGWRKVNVPNGVLVSATALSSFAGDIQIYDL
jgi:hypothetical protein